MSSALARLLLYFDFILILSITHHVEKFFHPLAVLLCICLGIPVLYLHSDRIYIRCLSVSLHLLL